MEYVFEFRFVIFVTVLAKVAHGFKRSNKLSVPASSVKEPPLRMRQFSLSRPTQLQAIAELLWFAEGKHERGEYIWFDDLPTIRNDQGLECDVLVRTIHFVTLLGEREELRRRNAIVLEVSQPNA